MKEYLVIKVGALGDTIMCLPLAKYIKKLEKNAKITWVVGKGSASLVRLSPYVDKIIVMDDKALLKGNLIERVSTVLATNFKICLSQYSAVITGHSDWRYMLLSMFCLSKKRIRLKPALDQSHIRRYIRLHDPEFDCDQPLDYGVDLSRLPKNSNPVDQFKTVIFSPGGAKNLLRDDKLRRWPLENYVSLASMLVSSGYDIILIGGPDDKYCEQYFTRIPCRSFIGQCSIDETLALLRKGTLFISHDSGPLHMAALAGLPVISIFGPTSSRSFELLSPNQYCFQGGKELSCSPCYDGKNYADCSHAQCMWETTPKMVFDKALEMMPVAKINKDAL